MNDRCRAVPRGGRKVCLRPHSSPCPACSSPPPWRGTRLAFPNRRSLGFLLSLCLLGSAPQLGASDQLARVEPTPYGATAKPAAPFNRHGAVQPAGATHLRKQAQARAAGINTELRFVAILVDFSNKPADRERNTVAHYQELLFSEDTHPTGSVADFIRRSSRGKLRISGEVVGWFTVSEEFEFYASIQNGTVPWVYPHNSQSLVEEAIRLADPYVNFAKYDNEGFDQIPDSGDDDELIDGVLVVAAGTGREGGARADELTSIQWFTSELVPVDGVFGHAFTLNPENGNVGVFVHEIGHILGLPDLYGGSGTTFGLGMWSIMSGGSHLESGVYPADFDAWSKSKIGFANPVHMFSNRSNVTLKPHVDGGNIYRMWTSGGGGQEYFLVENRQARDLDRSLAGSGVFIYHVDEHNQGNGDPRRPLVALEQADGKFGLELRYNNPSFGDEGDPFKEGQSFSEYSYPNSRGNSGHKTHVAVTDIQGPDETGTMSAALLVEPTADIDLTHVEWIELEGDGDGFVGAGETGQLIPHLYVDDLPAFDVHVDLTVDTDFAAAAESHRQFSVIPVRNSAKPSFEISIAATLDSNPQAIDIPMEVRWAGGPSRSFVLTVGVGSSISLDESFETKGGWSVEPMHPAALSPWFHYPNQGTDGTGIYICGVSNGFPAQIDGALVSPPVLLPAKPVLYLDHAFDVVPEDSMMSQAGGFVEISINGGPWQDAVPLEGYSGLYHGQHPNVFGRRVWTGTLANGELHRTTFDLRHLEGTARFRFRFLSDLRGPSLGWMIDRVSLASNPVAVELLSHTLIHQSGDIHIDWELGEPLPVQVRWLRGETPYTAIPVGQGWIPGADRGSLVDADVPRGMDHVYWFEALERTGVIDRHGPFVVRDIPQQAALRVALAANPSRRATVFNIEGDLPPGTQIRIFDVQGRLVRTQPIHQTGSWVWDGSSDRGAAAPGVYFARVLPGTQPAIRIVRLP